MSNKEIIQFKAVLKRQHVDVKGSKEAARHLLLELGLITEKGNLSKSLKPFKSVK